jgi:lysophospholipase L1-like esterase
MTQYQGKQAVFLGDSLTSGIGAEKGWVARLDLLINGSEKRYELINKGIAGDTSGGMLARFDRDVLSHSPNMVFILGGGNDFLAGASVQSVRANLFALVHQAWHSKICPVVCSPILPDFGTLREDWKSFTDFSSAMEKLESQREWLLNFSRQFSTSFIDFETEFINLLKQNGNANFNRSDYFSDGLHPNDKGAEIMASIVYNAMVEML